MNYQFPRRSSSLKELQASKELNSPLLKSPSFSNLTSSSTSRYQLWPSARSPVGSSSDKVAALAAGRSGTSLSDTAALPESLPFWQRTGSLSRRRKVSITELSATMTTVQEVSIDSPTIPGRPPLRQPSYETFGHERSYSAPGTNWRSGPFGDAMMACVTGPSPVFAPHATSPFGSDQSNTTGRPLSPILSPGVSPKTVLKIDTASVVDQFELPPQVPPKSPAIERKGSPSPLKLSTRPSKPSLATASSGGQTPLSASEPRRSPKINASTAAPSSAVSNSFFAASPASNRNSPRIEKRDPLEAPAAQHNRNISESAIADRGRPSQRNIRKERSRTCSETNNPETPPVADNWTLPQGMRVSEAMGHMSDVEQKYLHKQAYDQAGNFEVMNKRNVASMSRELRALDERCDYLRKTYKSLRAGRQKLHGRMISYLRRGETVIFSRESLLKQEEALAELDNSIDEFISKLELAENRRLRLRQKLLEHVAAALVLNPTLRGDIAETTPPRSPIKSESTDAQVDDTESIRIYADGQVLNLFSNIEKAIGHLCEQTC